ncbi:hypothetical protein [Pseudalkalibacillus decolorationis]|nr:hypothetical protein [Pseudalkalibacillus decolorationis]
MDQSQFPIADVKNETLEKIKQYERELQKDHDEEIVLIAYQKEQQ